jgi:hypothetical protein
MNIAKNFLLLSIAAYQTGNHADCGTMFAAAMKSADLPDLVTELRSGSDQTSIDTNALILSMSASADDDGNAVEMPEIDDESPDDVDYSELEQFETDDISRTLPGVNILASSITSGSNGDSIESRPSFSLHKSKSSNIVLHSNDTTGGAARKSPVRLTL